MTWESGGIAPDVFNFGNRWRWVVTFTLRRNRQQCLMDGKLDRPLNWIISGGEE
jgi:hypothetical protein